MFQQPLERLVQKIDGGLAALVIRCNGVYEDVFSVEPEPVDFKALAADTSVFLAHARRMASALQMGSFQECAVQTEKYNVLLRIINRDYFLALVTVKTSFLGRSKLFLELTALELQGKIGHEEPQDQTR